MRRIHGPLTLLLVALALAGCTTQQDTSADRFQGAEREVAEVVDDLAAASRSGDGEEICTRILTARLAEEVAAGEECKDEVEQALADANDYDLEVEDVTVSGNTATAEVRQGDDGRTGRLELARERGGWRVVSLGS
jgi:outer membrane PBP1 activator LpoA protein